MRAHLLIICLSLVCVSNLMTVSGLNMKSMSVSACKYGDFGDYGFCLNNVKTKYRAVITGDPATCLETTRTQACRDCHLGDWYDVGACVNGKQLRKRDKLNEPVNGGAKCSNIRSRVVNCGGTPTINSYLLGEGQFWYSAPKAYTCLEACAYNFGGVPTDYQCSTSGTTVTNTGYYDQLYFDTDGDETRCPVREENAKREPIYFCDDEGCSISAYVSDHNGCKTKVNYCWKGVVAP